MISLALDSCEFGSSDGDDAFDYMTRIQGVNPPAIIESVEEQPDTPVKKFGSFRVANQRIKKVSLRTPLMPDHSYNAVSFNVSVKRTADKWVFITGFEASGYLQEITIFKLVGKNVNNHKNDKSSWDLIHRRRYNKSWRRPTILQLEKPVRIGPGETCGFYIHSNCENDKGLKYRSCAPGVVLEDALIKVSHGWAHTSSIPFDATGGWIREHRVLSGSIFYEPTPRRWSPDRNILWQDKSTTYQLALDAVMSTKYFSTGILVELMSFCGMDWFNREIELPYEKEGVASVSNVQSGENKKLAYEPRRYIITRSSMMHRLSGVFNGVFRTQRAISAPLTLAPQQIDVDVEESSVSLADEKENQSDEDEFDALAALTFTRNRST